MSTERYWYLAGAPLSVPWWTEVLKWAHREGVESVDAPVLFSTLAGAEEELHSLYGAAADEYLRLVEQHGEEEVNEAYENTPPMMIHSLDAEMLLYYLENSDFLCVRIDGRLRLRQDLVEELRERVAEGED